jgi:hypothetical protein
VNYYLLNPRTGEPVTDIRPDGAIIHGHVADAVIFAHCFSEEELAVMAATRDWDIETVTFPAQP